MDHGPMLSIAASKAACPFCNKDRRNIWATITGITMYKPTEMSSVAHGTMMLESPSRNATSGANATTMMLSFSATWDSVNSGSPPVRRLQTNTIAVQGAAANRISPAM
jgi:hypothetical protein